VTFKSLEKTFVPFSMTATTLNKKDTLRKRKPGIVSLDHYGSSKKKKGPKMFLNSEHIEEKQSL